MNKIGKRKITYEQSTNNIDWKLVAEALAKQYIQSLQGGIHDERTMERGIKEFKSS